MRGLPHVLIIILCTILLLAHHEAQAESARVKPARVLAYLNYSHVGSTK
jgi:hypothetical protein